LVDEMTEDTKDRLIAAYQIAAQGEYDHARMILEESLYDDSKNMDAWMLLADLAENKDEAIQCYQMVLEIDPANWIAQKRLALLFGQGQAAEAPEEGHFALDEEEEFPSFEDFLVEEGEEDELTGEGPTLKESFAAHRRLVVGVGIGVLAAFALGALAWVGSLVFIAWRMGYLILGG
jgi:tetratricopeptide (TPR) repeat protein